MKKIPRAEVRRRLEQENPWWRESRGVGEAFRSLRRRAYFDLLLPLVIDLSVRRAVLLMGPRRVGKTVLLHQVIQHLIESGVEARDLCYLSVDHPIYNGCGLHDLLEAWREARGERRGRGPVYVFFDEIQYLKDWEVHLKVLVDEHVDIRFVASGSAAAALRLKSRESGAGRFTEFMLPPLTFFEYLDLLGQTQLVDTDIEALNESFMHYLNYGGYPEVLFSESIQRDPERFIKSDIIDKVLLRDLPGLYGISDIQELNSLFTMLAYNTANEISLDQLSKGSGVAKNTIKRYIDYLEAAFLIKVVHRIDRNGKRFQRANFFKVYLTNPSIRTALFAPVASDDEDMPALVETGVFSQWFHSPGQLHYARWAQGEVDIVRLGPDQKPDWAVEVKWSDRFLDQPGELKSLRAFLRANRCRDVVVTTRTLSGERMLDGTALHFLPASDYCYSVGFQLIRQQGSMPPGRR